MDIEGDVNLFRLLALCGFIVDLLCMVVHNLFYSLEQSCLEKTQLSYCELASCLSGRQGMRGDMEERSRPLRSLPDPVTTLRPFLLAALTIFAAVELALQIFEA